MAAVLNDAYAAKEESKVNPARASRISLAIYNRNSILRPDQQEQLSRAEQLQAQLSKLKKPVMTADKHNTVVPAKKSVMFNVEIANQLQKRLTRKSARDDDEESSSDCSSSNSGG